MRFGLIGYGAFGRLHAQCLNKLEGAELTAVCTGPKGLAAARVDFPGIDLHPDYRDLVQSTEVDVVDIVTPNYLHAEMGMAALEAGKDVLLEKPLATTVAECDRLVETARNRARLLSVNHELRVSTQWAGVKRLIDEGAIGVPRYANLNLFRHPYRPGSRGWRHDPRRVGSWILEEMVHFFDLVLWYFEALGDPQSVRATGTVSPIGAGDVRCRDNFSVVLEFPGGAHAALSQSLTGFGHHVSLDVTGEEGALRTWWNAADARAEESEHALQVMRAGATESETLALAVSGEVFELEEHLRRTVSAFSQGRAPMPGEAARKSVVVCLEAERSASEGEERALRL